MEAKASGEASDPPSLPEAQEVKSWEGWGRRAGKACGRHRCGQRRQEMGGDGKRGRG